MKTPKTNKRPKLVGPKSEKSKKTKPKLVVPTTTKVPLIKSLVKWDDAYPYIEETFRSSSLTVEVAKYLSSAERTPVEFEKFLYEVVRTNNLPPFVKNNFKKLRKLIEKEIQHRDKLVEKLTKEHKTAFVSYFKDDDFFERSDRAEYFDHEMEKVYVNYLKSYCETGIYESHVRLANRKRRDILKEHGIEV